MKRGKYFAGHCLHFGLPEGTTAEEIERFVEMAKRHFGEPNPTIASPPFRYIAHVEDWWDKKKKSKSCRKVL